MRFIILTPQFTRTGNEIVNPVYVNIDHISSWESNGTGGSTVWILRRESEALRVKESPEEIQRKIEVSMRYR